jgi:hypothetical protein
MDAFDQDLVRDIQERMRVLVDDRENLLASAREINAQIKRYERTLKSLIDEPQQPKRVRPPRPVSAREKSIRQSDWWPERREGIIAYIREHGESRQIDWRKAAGVRSGESSIMFRILRDDDVIRISRVAGVHKYYRLTKEFE